MTMNKKGTENNGTKKDTEKPIRVDNARWLKADSNCEFIQYRN